MYRMSVPQLQQQQPAQSRGLRLAYIFIVSCRCGGTPPQNAQSDLVRLVQPAEQTKIKVARPMTLFLLFLGSLCGGCSRLAPDKRVETTVARFERLARQSDDSPESAPPESADSEDSATNDAVPDTAPDVQKTTDFQPPYPNRRDPFRQPDVRKLASDDREAVEDTAGVALKGFLNVNGLRALMAIDGRVLALAPGEQLEGIRVIEIAPPQIILQRGRLRWSESLYTRPN